MVASWDNKIFVSLSSVVFLELPERKCSVALSVVEIRQSIHSKWG